MSIQSAGESHSGRPDGAGGNSRKAGRAGHAGQAGKPPAARPASGSATSPAADSGTDRSGHRTAAVIPAAGRGVRLGPGAPKALRALSGTPMLVHAVRAMTRSRAVSLVVVVAPPDGADEVRRLLDEHLAAAETLTDVVVVPGGETRQDSVRLGLEALPGDVDSVLVHDAARPLVPVETVDAVAAAVREGAPAVVPALPVPDTVKEVRVRPAGEPEPVTGTPERSRLRAVQTPQGFELKVLAAAHAQVAREGDGATDDAGMVERLGVEVVVVPGHDEAFKVTRPLDLVLAEAVLARRRATDGF
ncbi:2-C-methyl-D-erythritol 4-phosphate cytidylyltransferase [Streptomyces sp. WMMB 322]|uniref:2-C-methyl-D-erythritol 4-phosphate cytidylyltransferase n=1 Tax=Streptomyces sp. WMMB 322 TaxID=1286821 RepID=UPI00099F39A8|nr:2-C-methyl-D-erythritol 4-phosphate cytidylyltransferase [Streptomyces sp. WMMB 322]